MREPDVGVGMAEGALIPTILWRRSSVPLLCYRCGSHVPDASEACASCGQKLGTGGVRQATATFSRRRMNQSAVEGAPYKPEDIVANRYVIRDTLGAGPVGFVFRAHDREVDVEVALKVINPRLAQTVEERKQFAKALRVGRKLSHPNMARIYEEGEDKDRPFYTSQFLEGLSLRKIIDLRISRGQFFALKEIEPILGQIAAALEGSQKLGPHTDLKPENVLVLPDLLKLTDFGLALAIPRLPFVQAMKPRRADRYVAPEYVEGGEVDVRADVYALGVIIGEMLAGVTPDGSAPPLATKNPEVPPAIEGLFRKAVNQNPLARFKSAKELFEDFADAARRVTPPPLRNKPEPAASAPSSVPRTRPPSMPAGAALQLTPRRTAAEKEPPPAPNEALAEQESLRSDDLEEIPPDATQPMDAGMIPGEVLAGRTANPKQNGASGAHPPILAPSLPDRGPNESRPLSKPIPSGGVAQPSLSRRRKPSRGKPAVWLVVLTAAGLVIGSVGGYLIRKLQRRSMEVVVMQPGAPPLEPARSDDAGEQMDPERPKAGQQVAQELDVAPGQGEKPGRAEQETAPEEQRLADPLKGAPESPTPKLTEPKSGGEAAKSVAAAKASVVAGDSGCPDGMRFVPAGVFRMGTPKDDPMTGFDERVLGAVEVSAYCIDVYEYPNRRGVSPTVNVSWNDAKRLCEGKGKRLCSEEEWEKACKGPSNARFPYGNQFEATVCNTQDEAGDDRALAPTGKFPRCRSSYGVFDLAGNVAEWTSSLYATTADRAQKGGAFNRPDYASRCSARKNGAPVSRGQDLGFRCCANAR